MVRDKIKVGAVILASLFTIACNQTEESLKDTYFTIQAKDYVHSTDEISLKDEIESIEYVSLELTDDNRSMIGQVLDIVLTKDFIYILSDPTCGVLQFDRQGKFIRQVAKYGQGPGELIFPISMDAVEEENKLYITAAYKTTVYNFDGHFEEEFERGGRMSFYACPLGNGLVAETSSDGMPFASPGHFGIGIFGNHGKGDTLRMKNDFSDEKIFPPQESGFKLTRCISSDPGVLFSTMTNDTVFRMTPDTIRPAFCWQRDLNEESLKNSYRLLNFIPTNTELFL